MIGHWTSEVGPPTHSAEDAEWMGHPEFYFPPVAMRLRWMGTRLLLRSRAMAMRAAGRVQRSEDWR